MPLTEDQRTMILQDFGKIFRDRYGDWWLFFLTSRLTPSPIAEIARQRNVSISSVRKIRKEIRCLGDIFLMYVSFYIPPNTSNSQYTLDVWQ